MAQVGKRGKVSKLGLAPKPAVVAALAILVLVLFAIGTLGAVGSAGITVERSASQVASTEVAAPEPAHLPSTSPVAPETSSVLYVHIDGAVANPGVYSLKADDARVNDVVGLAGGLRDDADTSLINLAAELLDGQKIHVPAVGEQDASSPDGGSTAQHAAASEGQSQLGLVNINTASADELDSLPGVGPSTAAAIIEDREVNGPFASVEDLMRVSGIGEKKFAKLQSRICV